MTRRPQVPGLSDAWADKQMRLDLEPACDSCTLVMTREPMGPWDCDPDRPGCPLHQVPEKTR